MKRTPLKHDGLVASSNVDSEHYQSPSSGTGLLAVLGLTVLTPVTVAGLLIGRVSGAVSVEVLLATAVVSLALWGLLLLTPLAPSVRWWFERDEKPDDFAHIPGTSQYRTGHILIIVFSLYCWSVALVCSLYVLLSWASTGLPGALKLVVLLPAAWSTMQVVGLLLTEQRREAFARNWNSHFRLGIVTGITVVTSGLLITYSSASLALTRQGLLSFFTRDQGAPETNDFMSFYTWQILDIIPALDANSTLQWEMPLAYEGIAAGAFILWFKVLVLIAVVKTVIVAFRVTRG
jgi:hypothetical protein